MRVNSLFGWHFPLSNSCYCLRHACPRHDQRRCLQVGFQVRNFSFDVIRTPIEKGAQRFSCNNNNNNNTYVGLSSQGDFVPIAMESHGPVNRDVLRRVGQAIGGDDRGCSSFFVFVPTDLRLQSNDLTLFCCMMVLLMMTSQSRVHCQTLFISFCNF